MAPAPSAASARALQRRLGELLREEVRLLERLDRVRREQEETRGRLPAGSRVPKSACPACGAAAAECHCLFGVARAAAAGAGHAELADGLRLVPAVPQPPPAPGVPRLHPVRRVGPDAVLAELRRAGPAGARDLAARLGACPHAVRQMLVALGRRGLAKEARALDRAGGGRPGEGWEDMRLDSAWVAGGGA